MGAAGSLGMFIGGASAGAAATARLPADIREQIRNRVWGTAFVDTHEHLIEESDRLQATRHPRVRCDDWAFLLSHYLDSDLTVAGMSPETASRLFSPEVDPLRKWELVEPHWASVRHTGYAQAVRLACRELYGVQDLSADSVGEVQAGYERTRRRGFYEQILRKHALVESCQVNCLTGEPFKESGQPTLLMQDLSIVGMFAGPALETYARPTGIGVQSLKDWERVMDWWFARYARYAVAVKSQHAYSRDIDYQRVDRGVAEPIFGNILKKVPVSAEERRQLEDHLFWAAVERATEAGLPVKLHTGYYAGHNGMPLSRVSRNANSAAELCRLSPGTKFVFMHICYPFYDDLLAVAKHYSNAYVDLCWAWIINPIATKDFLKKYLVSVPAHKILTFGGDYIPVEPVVGHAILARRGISLALAELVEEGWLDIEETPDLVESLMRGNARALFQLPEKERSLAEAPWASSRAQ
jgi:predicted TIM-barrel fold metal-dependent hydrolase